ALGLLPIGSSEGGHLLHSLLGHSKAVLIGRLSRLVLFAISLSRYHILLFPALLLLWLDIERLPALNDVDELSEGEDLMAIGLLVLGILILFPGAG
ncbi:MAG: site-2 protease family protein, partial [Cyanobacteria bacterium KgW148]|nr:site-2 protease family protein [Cyanobacteria bacterium KgW148]